jgi:hypothetical protein
MRPAAALTGFYRVLSFISVGLTNGVKIKWLADYCGTSVAMIEKHTTASTLAVTVRSN